MFINGIIKGENFFDSEVLYMYLGLINYLIS